MAIAIEFARLIARSIQRAVESGVRPGRIRNPRHAFRLTAGPAQEVWLGCDALELSQLPAGAVFIDAPLAQNGLPTIKVTPGLTTGEASLSGGSYRFLDKNAELGSWLAGKAANGLQMFSRTIEQFDLDEDETLNDFVTFQRSRRYTLQIQDAIKADNAVWEIKTGDIQRRLEVDIFDTPPFKLYSPILDTQSIIPITLPVDEVADHDYRFEHGNEYLVAPGQTLGILLLNDEYIGYDSLRTDELSVGGNPVVTLGGTIRGMFGTKPVAHDVSEDTPPENRPSMAHVAYAEEDWASMALMLMTGKTEDGRAFPFSAGVDERWIHQWSFTAASAEGRRTLRRHEKVVAKRFIEEQILSRMPAIMVPDARGRLMLRPVQFFRQPEPENVLDESSCYGGDLGSLDVDATDCKFPFNLLWDLEPISDTWRQNTQWIDEPSAIESGVFEPPDPITYESEMLTTGRSTEAEIRRTAGVLHSKHALPVKRLSAKPTSELWHLLPGEAVTVRHYPRDYKTDDGQLRPIDTTMLISSVSDDQNSQQVTWELVGYQAPSPAFTQAADPLPIEAFTDGGTPLPGVSGGVAGNTTLELGRKYYYLGNLTYPANWSPTFTGSGDLIIWHQGAWEWAAQISLVGRGHSQGEPGYHRAPPPSGSWTARTYRYENSSGDPQGVSSRRIRSYWPPMGPGPLLGDIPETMSVEDGRVVGMPRTLSGAGGLNSDDSSWYESSPSNPNLAIGSISGSAGGKGGGGVFLLGAGGSGFVGSGRIDISGADGAAPVQILAYTRMYGASGGGGGHGHAVFVTDGPGTLVNVDGTRLIAQSGNSVLQGERLESARVELRGAAASSGVKRSYYDPPNSSLNQWEKAHSIGFVPASQRAVDTTYTSIFDEFFANQRDGNVRLYIQNVRPSDASLADMWITKAQLDLDTFTPISEVLTGSGWQQFNWGSEKFEYVYAALIAYARRFGSTEIVYAAERPAFKPAGTIWIDSRTGTEWLLQDPPTPDILLRVPGAGPVGENLLSDLNMAGEGQGISNYIFTRDGELQPLSALDIVVEELRRAFIAMGTLEGEYIDPATTSGGGVPSVTVPEPRSVSVTVLSPTSARIDWLAPLVQTYVDSYEIVVGNDFISGVSGSPYTVTGLTPDTLIFLGVQTKWNGPPETFSGSVGYNTAMPADPNSPGVDEGITLSDTGRSVVGIARVNGSTTLIGSGRQIILTLDDGTQFFTNVGSGGAFTFNVPAGSDSNLTKPASLYTNNGDDSVGSVASLTFTYEL